MTGITHRILVTATSMLLVATLGPARTAAQSINVATETDSAALYKYAKARYAAGDVLGALEAYQRSCDIQPTMEACANAGNAAYQLGHYSAAATVLRTALGLVPPTLEHEGARKKVQDRLAEAKAKCGELLLTVEPAGATILVNDKQVDTSAIPESVFVGVGQHRITIRMVGYQPVTLTTQVSTGGITRLPVLLKPVEDGLGAGHDSGDDVRVGVGIGGLVLGAASLAVGVGVFLASETKMSASEQQRAEITAADPTATNPCGTGVVLAAQCAELQDTQSAYNAFRGGGVAAMVTGGAFAVTGLIVLLTGGESGNVEAAPVVGPGRIGGQVQVRF